MELTLDEQTLLAAFRRLSPEGKKEALDYVAFLKKKHSAEPHDNAGRTETQCRLEKADERPEAAKEPIFTE